LAETYWVEGGCEVTIRDFALAPSAIALAAQTGKLLCETPVLR